MIVRTPINTGRDSLKTQWQVWQKTAHFFVEVILFQDVFHFAYVDNLVCALNDDVDLCWIASFSGEIDVFWVGFRPKSGGHHDWDRLFRDSWVLRCGEFSRKISSTEASPWETL